MRQARTLVATGLVVIGATLVGMFLGEMGLRLFYPQPMGVWHQDRDGLALHWPGLVTYLPQFGGSVSFNSAGMRDREHAPGKPEGVFRILVLGDSFMEALQVPFESSFPSLLERMLAGRTGRAIEVVNASVSGWGTDDQLKYLTSYGRRWKPDLILVVMTLHNDISDNLRERFHETRDGVLVEKPRERASLVGYQIIRLKGLLATRSHVYQLLIRAKRAREVQGEARRLSADVVELFREPPTERMSKGLVLTGMLLQRVEAIASEDGSRLVVVLVPLAMQVSDERFAEFSRAVGSVRGLEIDRPQRLMSDVAGRLGGEVIDLLPGFREWTAGGGGRLYLERDGHWSDAGHRLAARIVAAELAGLRLVAEGER